MKNFYNAYTRVVQNTTFYFVKKYVTFPEYKDVPNILETYGMHKDFNRACQIAKINDDEIKKQLLNNLQSNAITAKIIQMKTEDVLTAIQ